MDNENIDNELNNELVSDAKSISIFDNEILDEESSDDSQITTLELTKKITAYLFLTSKPISLEKLVELTKCSREMIQDSIDNLSDSMRSIGLGFEILEINETFHFRSLPELTKDIHKLITPKMKRLSKAAAETLAVIAYKQPVSKAEIEAIRGVDPLPTIKTLVDGKLIRIVGREDTPGSPALYGTSDFFLERFGLSDLSELPTIKELQALDDETGEDLLSDDFSQEDLSEEDSSEESIPTEESNDLLEESENKFNSGSNEN